MLGKQCYGWCLSLAAPCMRNREMPFPRESHNNDSAASSARPHVGRAGASPSPEMAILVTNECWMCPVVSDVPEAAGRVQQGKDCSVLTISDALFLCIHHCWRGDAGWSVGWNPTNEHGSGTAGRQAGKKRSNILFLGALLAFLCLLFCVVSFSSSHILQDYGKRIKE